MQHKFVSRRCVSLSVAIELQREGASCLVLVLLGGSDGEVEARQKELWTMTEQCEERQTVVNAQAMWSEQARMKSKQGEAMRWVLVLLVAGFMLQ